jgi:hypothetical protein
MLTVGAEAFVAVISFARVFEPSGPNTVRVAENVPAFVYVWLGLVAALVPLSPNLHTRPVIVPLDASVKVTANGVAPLVGLAVNPATGGTLVTTM